MSAVVTPTDSRVVIPSKPQVPLFFAREEFIVTQRIVALAMIVLGIVAIAFAGITGIAIPIGTGLVVGGGIVFGSSLIQQVVGKDPETTRDGKIRRVIAGVSIMIGGPIGWVVGCCFWVWANHANAQAKKLLLASQVVRISVKP